MVDTCDCSSNVKNALLFQPVNHPEKYGKAGKVGVGNGVFVVISHWSKGLPLIFSYGRCIQIGAMVQV